MLCTDFEWGFPEPMETPLPTPLYTILYYSITLQYQMQLEILWPRLISRAGQYTGNIPFRRYLNAYRGMISDYL